MPSLINICSLIVLLLLPSAVAASDWPTLYRDSTNRNSVIDQPELPLTEVGSLSSLYIKPLVQGDILITAESNLFGNRLVARQLSSLSLLWYFPLGSLVPRQPVIDRGTVYFGVVTQPTVYAISLLTGQSRWQTNLSGESLGLKFAPVIIQDWLFVSVGNFIHRLTVDGHEDWLVRFVVDSPLAADDGNLYLRTHDQKISQLDPATGAITWSYFTNTTAGTAPVVTGNTIYAGTYQRIVALEKTTGQPRWVYDTPNSATLIGNLASVGSQLIFGTNDGTISALTDLGKLLWRIQFNQSVNGWQPSFIVAGDRVLTQVDTSNQLILNATNGGVIFQGPLSHSGASFQLVAENKIFTTQNNQLFILTADHWIVGSLGDPAHHKRIDPVVIVPGLLESWPVRGEWKLDPVTHSFDNLLTDFRAAGYIDNQTLFTFPYDWHASNTTSADLLAQKIAAIRIQTGSAKVDVVAHSMGGLVARAYIESPNYANDIDELVTLGTPHHGSVKAYFTWEAAETGTGRVDRLKQKFIAYEATKHGYFNNAVGFVHDFITSVNELLPTFDYLEKNNQLTVYAPCSLFNYPCNQFLDNLNTNLDELVKRVNIYNIIGKTTPDYTPDKLIVTDSTIANYWLHGMPLNFPSSQGIINNAGDGTVALHSAHQDGVEEIVFPSEHSALLTDAARFIVKRLSDVDVVLTPKVSPLRYLFIRLFSPINLLLADQQGRRLGTDPQTGVLLSEIPEAFYSGEANGEEYAIIPDPADDQYKLSIQGTATGEYKVVGNLIDDSAAPEATQTGTTEPAATADYSVSLTPDTIRIDSLPTPSPSPVPTSSPTPCPVSSPTSQTIRPP